MVNNTDITMSASAYQPKMYGSNPGSTTSSVDFTQGSSARGGSVHIQVLGANNLRQHPDGRGPNAAIQLCVRDKKVGYENEFSYGKSVWLPAAGPNTDPTWPKASAVLDVMNPDTSQVIVAVFNTTAMDNKNRFLGEVILNIEKLKPLSSPVKDQFALQPTPYLPEVEVSGSVNLMVKYILPLGSTAPRVSIASPPVSGGTPVPFNTSAAPGPYPASPGSQGYYVPPRAEASSYRQEPPAPETRPDRRHMTITDPEPVASRPPRDKDWIDYLFPDTVACCGGSKRRDTSGTA